MRYCVVSLPRVGMAPPNPAPATAPPITEPKPGTTMFPMPPRMDPKIPRRPPVPGTEGLVSFMMSFNAAVLPAGDAFGLLIIVANLCPTYRGEPCQSCELGRKSRLCGAPAHGGVPL